MDGPHGLKTAAEAPGSAGAYVRRSFDNRRAGDELTRDELAKIPRANLDALVSTGLIELFHAGPDGMARGMAERFPVHIGFGKYLVVEGVKLTPEPVTREEADKLCGTTPN